MAYAKPSNVQIQGQPASEGEEHAYSTSMTAYFGADMVGKSSESKKRRMQVDYSLSPSGPWITEVDFGNGFKSPSTSYRGNVVVGFVTDENLLPNTVYYYRVYAQLSDGTVGSPYYSGSFLTPETPNAPNLDLPTNESDISVAEEELTFTWDYVDEGNQDRGGSYFYWRTAPAVGEPAGEWHTYTGRPGFGSGEQAWEWYPELPCFPPDQIWEGIEVSGQAAPARSTCPDPSTLITYSNSPQKLVLPTTLFPLNTRIEWRTANLNDVYDANGPVHRGAGDPNVDLTLDKMYLHPSPQSGSRYFTIIGPTSAPVPLDPINDEANIVSEPIEFSWRFRDPVEGTTQKSAKLRYRNVFDDEWIEIDLGDDYTEQTYTLPANVLESSTHYEWQVQSTNDRGEVSDWSVSALFWGIVAPGSGLVDPTEGDPLGALGCGTHRVFIYDRGGIVRRGEIGRLDRVIWERRRDDIGEASVVVSNWDEDCGDLLANTHTWQHEMVIFRTNEQGIMERVWEGPIVRLTYRTDTVEIHAKDVMAYVYRRVMRQGYNDAYRIVNNVQIGLKTVIYRAAKIITNALAYDDPNLIPYLTLFEFDDDARQSRVVEAFSRTAWEEVDDLAATAGLDYTAVGRRIILNDTHRQIGLLPEMRDGDFSDDPIVSEYGMQLANFFAVTNNSGVYGYVDRFVDGQPQFYGYIEQLASAYGEADGAAQTEVLTPEALAALQATLTEQAERNISGRYPAPVVVRVPDQTTLNPDVPVGINQLVPGVWVPVRSVGTLREIAQMQKLDVVRMTEEKGQETITITLSPAPNPRDDAEPTPEEE